MFRLVDSDDPLAAVLGGQQPSMEEIKKESKKKLWNNFFYFSALIMALRIASSILNDGSPIVKIT